MEKIIPQLSIVMPVYNSGEYLSMAIDSILNQTYKNFELILVNDGSTDNSLKIINEYAKRDPRIIIINNETNKGLIYSLNKGLNVSRGRYIGRMDSDDVCVHDRFEKQINYLDSNPDIFLISGSFYVIDESGKVLRKKQREYTNDEVKSKIFKFGIIHHPTVVFRNEGDLFYREKVVFGEDVDLWSRFITQGKKIYVSSEIVLYYRIHGGSISSRNVLTQKAFIKKVFEWYKQRLEYGIDDYDSFDPDTLIQRENDTNIMNKRRQVKIIFLSDCDKKIILNEIKKYWAFYGFLSWPASFLLYLICSLPNSLSFLVRRKIRKTWE